MIRGIVALVGRPNVGKSTLFNRLTGQNQSIIRDQPGVTRDCLYGVARYEKDGRDGFTIVDTGGLEGPQDMFQPFEGGVVWRHTMNAVLDADLVVLMLDGREGIHPRDHDLVREVQKTGRPMICVVNKIDGIEHQGALWEFHALGLGEEELHPLCAKHSRGIGTLRYMVQDRLENISSLKVQADHPDAPRIALLGKPNVGKSSILNRLLGTERSVVSPVAGTTRDQVDSTLFFHKKPYVIVDTAGVRRRTKIHDELESASVIRSLRGIQRADCVVTVIDAVDGMADQDVRLVNMAIHQFKPVLVVVNKWDLIEKDHSTAKQYTENLRCKFKDLNYLPVLFVSAKENLRVPKIMDQVVHLLEESAKRAPTSRVNEALQMLLKKHSPHLVRQKHARMKFYYATQVRCSPPTFVVKCNFPNALSESYQRYMWRGLRRELGFESVPVSLLFRGRTSAEDQGEQAALEG
ncbi:MAG: ribosome biogenesis GTPase Der [Oligoflexales bacterium]